MQAWLLRGVCVLIGASLSFGLREAGLWAVLPLIAAFVAVAAERLSHPPQVRAWTPPLIGAGVGLGLTALTHRVVVAALPIEESWTRLISATFGAAFLAGGILSFYHRRDFPLFSRPSDERRRSGEARILDTSVIIDGRIAKIARTPFLQGRLILPRFILKELQYIADSADTLRRNKGRRGMEALRDLQNNPDLIVEIVDDDFHDIEDVDAKLIALAKAMDGKIMTNDYNLKSIAEIQGVQVMNVNELANAVKPEIIQGEMMSVRVIREGKEPGQGVAYLDDGTMVVVDQGRDAMHHTVNVEVTSVLQTSAGRMIFARIREHGHRDDK